jgi:hypothetical protein
MVPNLEQRKREAAEYVEREIYDEMDIETEVVGATDANRGTRVGVAATPVSNGLLSTLSSMFSGTTYYYVTVTIDHTGQVVLSNKNLSRADFYERIDRPHEAEATRKRQEQREQFWEEQQQEAIEDVMDDPLSMDSSSSVPDRCPECKESGDLLQDQFEELGERQYQCRNEDCGHIVDLS